jgi:5-bromo-4-chloroindolyl phosphate hydrolysis protein
MKTALINLLKVKSIVTIVLTVIFSVLALKGVITGEQFFNIFGIVIAFYFGTQAQKAADTTTTTDSTTTTE